MKTLLYLLIPLILISCNQDFLDVKPSSNTVVPNTLEDFQQLLDADFMHYTTELTDMQTDDYYLENTYWQSMSNIVFRNVHVWAEDIYGTDESEIYGWNIPFQQMLYANIVLEGVQKIEPTDVTKSLHNQIQGSAYFVRAWAIHQLLQLYAPAYNAATAGTDLGIPLPQRSDVNEKMVRASNAASYGQIIADLGYAVELLTESVDYSRPSKAAALALLARVYLEMGEYESALTASKASLEIYSDLTDLNQVRTRDYKKSLYLAFMSPGTIIRGNSNNVLIDERLYEQYTESDLRKSTFFRIGNRSKPIKNSFHGLLTYCFSGLDTDEQFLIKAESLAHLDRIEESIDALNALLKRRYSTNGYVAANAGSKPVALSIIRAERRKELVFRGVRWSDLKRYNRDGAGITLKRILADQTFTLAPNSSRWLFPIPIEEIKSSGIVQNNRIAD